MALVLDSGSVDACQDARRCNAYVIALDGLVETNSAAFEPQTSLSGGDVRCCAYAVVAPPEYRAGTVGACATFPSSKTTWHAFASFDTISPGVGFLVANSCATPTEFRLPSREALAEIAIRGFASASAEEKNRRRGSYPPEDDVGVSRSAGDVASSGTADSEVRDRRSEAGRERPGSRISAHFGPTFSRATRRAYPNASARKQERGLGSGSAAFVRGVGDDHERLSRGDSGEDVGDGRGMIQNSTTSTGSYSGTSSG